MKLSELTKEQKQKFVLVALMSTVGLLVMVSFVLQPLRRKWVTTRSEYAELAQKLDEATQLLKQEVVLRGELEEKRVSMRHVVDDCIPDPENSLSWVTQRIYQYSRRAGVAVQSVSSHSSRGSPVGGQEKGRTFGMFQVNVMIQCTYADLLSFIEEVETRNPYVCVSSLIISGKPSSPERHNVSIHLQWPIWADLETAEKARERTGGDHG